MSPNMRPLAVTCAIHPCLRNYHGAISNNTLSETLISTIPATPSAEGGCSVNGFHSHTALKTPCVVDSVLYSTSNISLVPATQSTKFSTTPHLFEGVLAPDGTTNVTAPYECIYKLYWILFLAPLQLLFQLPLQRGVHHHAGCPSHAKLSEFGVLAECALGGWKCRCTVGEEDSGPIWRSGDK
ncbi:hypothetical protein B0T14DRAFT_527594 [Immersiella caudata]|uniref:Uncharacterized protein n=1 Tax=Immersiella caudata TaxID=314043 RepID=A0AA40BUG4_9PEZI|nr:hypothetical protein B0T14DRAFT_527594 [Immersiella caudata]